MLRDIEGGKPVEGDQILGDLLRRAGKPDHRSLLRIATLHVRAYEAGRKGREAAASRWRGGGGGGVSGSLRRGAFGISAAASQAFVGETALADAGPINWTNAVTLISVAILVGTELIGAGAAAGWAIGGLFQLARPSPGA